MILTNRMKIAKRKNFKHNKKGSLLMCRLPFKLGA